MGTSLYRRWRRARRNAYVTGSAYLGAAAALALFVSWVVIR